MFVCCVINRDGEKIKGIYRSSADDGGEKKSDFFSKNKKEIGLQFQRSASKLQKQRWTVNFKTNMEMLSRGKR